MPSFNGSAYATAQTQLGLALEQVATTVASGSNSGDISTIASWAHPGAGELDIASIANIPATGGIAIVTTSLGVIPVTFTGTSSGMLTGCTVPAGTASQTVTTGARVSVGVRGQAVAPEYWIPVKSPKYKPDLMLIPDETLQGSMVKVYDLVTGLRYDSHGWDAPPYLDSFPLLLAAEFGSADQLTVAPSSTTLTSSAAAGAATIATAASIPAGSYVVIGSVANGTIETHKTGTPVGTTSPYTIPLVGNLVFAQPSGANVVGLTTHQWSLLNSQGWDGNQPLSLTVTDYDGEEWRQITGAQLDELTIKGNGTGLVDYTCTMMGNPAVTPTTPIPSYTGKQTPAPWSFYSLLAGVYTPTVIDWEFGFKRGVKPIPALTGQQGYFEYFADVLIASGKLTFVEQAGSPELTNFLNAQRQAFDFTLYDQKAGAALNIHASAGEFQTGEIDRSKEWVQVTTEFQCLPTTGDTTATSGGVSPVIVTVANSVATAYN